MTDRILNKIRPARWLSLLVLAGMTGVFIKMAFAITAFTPQTQPTGYLGQVTLTNGTLTSGNETAYLAAYEKTYWSGNMYAYPVDANGVVSTNTERWSGGAAVNINTQNYSTGRFIGTMRDNGARVPFLSGSLSAAQQAALGATVQSVTYTSAQIVNFLRGDHSNESATTLRQRLAPQGTSTTPTVLGDILHSKPVYQADTTNPTVFAGANDGMLHAINSTNGTERWAYVPSMLLSKMKALAANPYTHDYYVDGPITIGHTNISGTSTRILVGALGAGGKGLYALNIDGSAGLTASSDQGAADKVLWEITPTTVNYATPQNNDASINATAYSNLGYTYGKPEIKTINNGGSALPVVIVGNGYNNGGDYQAYLYIINAENGRLVRAIKADSTATNTTGTAVTDGTAPSPNGLFNLVAFDTGTDGYIDRVYAGDLNGAMWKFDLSSTTPSSWSASVLHVTTPKQPVTATPAAISHPAGTGYMVNFATGSIFTGTQPASGVSPTGDLGDTSTFYVYGIWDGAHVSNTTLTQPVLTERCYSATGVPSATPCPDTETRVRRATSVTPDWSTGGNKGWQIALPIGGERVVGEGSFISSGRYYFSTYNPTISYLVPNTTTYVWGENWQMALDSVTGGSIDPFMDLNGNGTVTSYDRIKYTATDTEVLDGTRVAGNPITSPNADGIAVGKWVGRGVQSQPTLVKLTTLFTTLFNTNPDVSLPPPVVIGAGVSGGHFDEDIYYGSVTASTQATATITVGSTGSTLPATLGGIEICDADGLSNCVSIVPALSVTDITNGSATSTNATTIRNNVSSGDYTATVAGSTITLRAPAGASYNGKTITILAGTSSGSPAVAPANGTLVITAVARNRTVSLRCGGTYFGQSGTWTSSNSSTASTRLNTLYGTINGTTRNGYTTSCVRSPDTSAPASLTCSIAAPGGASACSGGFTVDSDITTTTNTGPSGGSDATGWSDLAPALSTTSFSGGSDGSTGTNTCTSDCTYDRHIHQYDDKFDVTGVNMLNASDAQVNLVRAIPSTAQNFKVIMHNQYLNPAVKLHIGDAGYLYNVNFGYISVKNYTTAATLDLATLPTYNRNTASTGDGFTGPKYIGSLAVNMPVDALTAKNWWGNGDVRVGLIPTTPGCVWNAAGLYDGNMYRPVRAPANDGTLGYPLDGPGTLGYNASTTPATATGLRHGGALTIQIIRDNTTNDMLELNDHLGRPEYGWRVKSANFAAQVLAEYNTYWHHPNAKCFHSTGWTKTPGEDTGEATPGTKAAGSTDPKIGDLSGDTSNIVSVVIAGDTITITYTDGSRRIIQKIANADDTVTTITTDIPAGVNGTISHVINADGTITTTITHADGSTATGTAAAGGSVTLSDDTVVSNVTTVTTDNKIDDGGLLDERGTGYRRISWKELIRE
ncbi:MAG: hypothetical protein A2V79_00800 [Betaproteobacteria bacterium RBG_16_56_24]|nr:MAG: hypothetical protein A2V79_00800 [Betaproteobacteria bacterium RBG_16_56_24]